MLRQYTVTGWAENCLIINLAILNQFHVARNDCKFIQQIDL